MTTTVYLIGVPGAGKTTLMRQLTALCVRRPVAQPVAHELLVRRGHVVAVELGRHRYPHAGTDALPYNAAPRAAAWIAQARGLVLAEGDRLACSTFFTAAARAGELVVVHLDTPAAMAAVRRRTQPDRRIQAPAWLKGRASKVARHAETATVHLDGSRPPHEVANDLLQRLPDVLAPLTPAGLRA